MDFNFNIYSIIMLFEDFERLIIPNFVHLKSFIHFIHENCVILA